MLRKLLGKLKKKIATPKKRGSNSSKKKSKAPAKKRKVSSKKSVATRSQKTTAGKPIGVVTHFFGGIKVAIVKFKKPVSVGETIRFEGATTKFQMTIGSMQYNHAPIKRAKKNQQIGIKVTKRVREGDRVYIAA